jgi:shikimate kinase
MNIVLIGYRGTGKSLVANELSKLLKMEFVEMDAEITRIAGLTIPQLIESFGWNHFRDLESQVAEQLAQGDNLIIDTGGGIVERASNMEKLCHNALTCWLDASIQVIAERIGNDTNRPRFTPELSLTEEITRVLERRSPLYATYADCHIMTTSLSPVEVAMEIEQHFHTKNQLEAP